MHGERKDVKGKGRGISRQRTNDAKIEEKRRKSGTKSKEKLHSEREEEMGKS